MALSFRRSLKGYDPVSVSNELSLAKQEFDQKLEALRQELANQIQQQETLRAEVEKLRQDLAPRLSLRDDVSRRLLTAHLQGAEKVLYAIQDMEKKELDLMKRIIDRKKELSRLHNVTGKMSHEFLATASRYGTMLNRGKVGDINVKN